MPVQIPLESDKARWSQDVSLGNTYGTDNLSFTDASLYTLDFNWNGRAGVWVFGIQDADGNDLLRGRALRLGALLLSGCGRAGGLPEGDFLLVDLTGEHQEAGLTSLGVTHQLLYFTHSELVDEGMV